MRNPIHKPYNKLRGKMIENGFSVKDIAKLLNKSEATIYGKINGVSDFTFSEVEKICNAFNIEVAAFSA